MKFCKDCKHLRPAAPPLNDEDQLRFAKCARTKYEPNFVTGKVEFYYANSSRGSASKCGKQAKWYALEGTPQAPIATRKWWKFWGEQS
jgi:hypothetical protein